MKRVFLTVAAAAIAGAGAWAQAFLIPNTEFKSPAKSSTFDRFGRDVDNILSVQDWKGTGFESWLTGASFNSFNGTNIAVGVAKKFGGLYLAAYYGGKDLTDHTSSSFTEQDAQRGGDWKTIKEYVDTNAFTGQSGTHNAGVLLGVGNMGFKLSFATNHVGNEQSDVKIGASSYHAKASRGFGSIVPQIEWGMAKNLAEAGIKPKIRATLDFYRNSTRYTDYENISSWDADALGEYIDTSANAFMPQFALNLGGYNFIRGEALTLGLDLDYTLSLKTYSNEFSYMDGSELKTAEIKGNTLNITELSENSYMDNLIAPSLKFTWSISEQFTAKGKLNLGFDIASETDTQMTNDKADLKKDGTDMNKSTFKFIPKLDLGFQYKLLEGKVVVNAGGSIVPSVITVESVETASYLSGVKDDHSTVTAKTTSTSAVSTAVRAGFTWNITNNAALDVATGVANGDSITLFGSGSNLTSFSQLLFTLAF